MVSKKKRLERGAQKANRAGLKNGAIPSREQVLNYIAENPARSGKREIARAFGVKGDGRIILKSILAELYSEGLLVKDGKRIARPNDLPPVTVIDIVTRDSDGGLLAVPVKWDESQQGKPPKISVHQDRKKPGPNAGVGDRVLARLSKQGDSGLEYNAKALKRLEKDTDLVLGVLRITDTDGSKEIRLEPTQKRQAEVEIFADALGDAKDGDLVEVETLKSSKYGLKRGRVKRVVGSLASEKAASMIAIYANEIRHIFPDEVIKEAEETKAITFDPASKYEDWRDLPLITIDPADAKDHDDAIFAEPDVNQESGGEDGHIIYVAIADVSAYVRSTTAMGGEALLRGNSVYFPDQVVPMLPEKISNNFCSLRENEERPALAVRMVFAADGRKIKHEFHRIFMRSHRNIAYPDAQNAIDGVINDIAAPIFDTVLKPLWAAYECLKRGRNRRQPLELDLPERKILLKEDGTVDRVIVPDRLDAHKLVEEFMIQANVAAAETLEQKRQKLIYRIHDSPSLEKLEKLREFLHSMDITLAKPGSLRAEHFNAILSRVVDSDKEELVNQVVLRSQSQAVYSPDNIGHFGLHLDRYAHFTSPIRRYADLTVHRALVGALGLGEGGITREEEARLVEIAAEISVTERAAMQAERETKDRLIAGHLSDQLGERFMGRINGVTRSGLFVTLADSGADGFIPISKLGDEYFHFDEVSYSLYGEDSATSYQMGQMVEVKLVEAAPVAGALRFEMLSDGVKSARLPSSRHKTKRGGGPTGKGNKFGRGGQGHKRRRR